MTSDAKIGLLLGLVFIFIIAFIINGLPNLRSQANNNELTITNVNTQNKRLGIINQERKVSRQFTEKQIRYKAPLPKAPMVVDTVESQISHKIADTEPLKEAIKQTLVTADKKSERKIVAVKPAIPEAYVVRSGDSLATIAQKFYGQEQGNKISSIQRIFKANKRFLDSPDEIYVGQKLIIPPLAGGDTDKGRIKKASSEMLDKIKAVSKRAVASDKRKAGGIYLVQSGDSLWKIADRLLGDGDRYDEILELNSEMLEDEDSLVIGMRLKIPTN